MDEKLKQFFKIRPLQTHCITYRSSNEYRKMQKQTCTSELKNLIDVEIKIEQIALKMPEEERLPKVTEDIKTSKVDYLLEELGHVKESIKLL